VIERLLPDGVPSVQNDFSHEWAMANHVVWML